MGSGHVLSKIKRRTFLEDLNYRIRADFRLKIARICAILYCVLWGGWLLANWLVTLLPIGIIETYSVEEILFLDIVFATIMIAVAYAVYQAYRGRIFYAASSMFAGSLIVGILNWYFASVRFDPSLFGGFRFLPSLLFGVSLLWQSNIVRFRNISTSIFRTHYSEEYENSTEDNEELSVQNTSANAEEKHLPKEHDGTLVEDSGFKRGRTYALVCCALWGAYLMFEWVVFIGELMQIQSSAPSLITAIIASIFTLLLIALTVYLVYLGRIRNAIIAILSTALFATISYLVLAIQGYQSVFAFGGLFVPALIAATVLWFVPPIAKFRKISYLESIRGKLWL